MEVACYINDAEANDVAVIFLFRYTVQDANGYFHSSTQETNLVMANSLYINVITYAYRSTVLNNCKLSMHSIWKEIPKEAG